ncbi:MAG: superoxide dismutase family protein [Eubacteriales bacterium]
MNQYNYKAMAMVKGSADAPDLNGTVWFMETPIGVHVDAKIFNLPPNKTGFYGFHLHEVGSCIEPDFESAKGHYNPEGYTHPMHAGDFPMLLATDTMDAYLSFVTTRFALKDVIGRSVIIHMDRDDYTSQPSGDAGKRIGCGVIKAM